MFQSILVLIAGLVLILLGAEAMVKGASGIARKLGISEFVIGLTIVAIGTSAPEMVVSMVGAAEGNSDVSAGNVMGSNIFNGLIILGVMALLKTVRITKTNKNFDIPWYAGFTLAVFLVGKAHTLFGIGSEDILSRPIGILMLLAFSFYIWMTFRKSGKATEEDSPATPDNGKMWLYIVMLLFGVGALIFGGRIFVDSAVDIAHMAGLSDKFIAITVLALGTSLPEFATSIIATIQGKSQLALGNVLGSNIFNIILVLGCSAVVSPVHMKNITLIDFGVLLLGAAVLLYNIIGHGPKKISWRGGIVFVALYAGYMIYLFNNL